MRNSVLAPRLTAVLPYCYQREAGFCSRRVNVAQCRPRARWAAFEDVLVITILVLLGFPDKNQRQLYVGEIPVLFFLYWLLSVLVLVRAVIRGGTELYGMLSAAPGWPCWF